MELEDASAFIATLLRTSHSYTLLLHSVLKEVSSMTFSKSDKFDAIVGSLTPSSSH